MTIALYIGAACTCFIGGFFAALFGVSANDRSAPLGLDIVFFALWLLCMIGSAALLVAGVKA